MNISELREKSVLELQQELKGLLHESLKLRFNLASQQLKQSHLLGRTRKDIARINTVLNEKRRSES